ncbi:MAG TPA: Sir2 family NAD-dependent protein deacetylase [Dehalococcoidia bacterium]|nr:Sir2 family NAD-dependent protein deacetylase [Dehalococcoidia bacterium]
MVQLDVDIAQAAQALVEARHAIALVGAGISVESGIPPFRGAGGLWTKHGEPPMDGYARAMEDLPAYCQSMLARRDSDDEFSRAIRDARPNPAHHALADLERLGVLKHTISQNIDNLHAVAGQSAVTEIHGNRTKLRCIDCGARWPFAEFAITEVPPSCPHCRGIVKGDTVMFGEPIPQAALAECYEQAGRADCMLLAGTSATVVPAAWFPDLVLERGGALIEVNPEPTPFTSRAAVALRAPAGEALPRLADAVARIHGSEETT